MSSRLKQFFCVTTHSKGVLSRSQVPESAKETCRNWLFKIASIRELIPRLYVEASILRCYSFLSSDDRVYKTTLERLAAMTCGIGDPLVSMYARCYVCRVGAIVAPGVSTHLLPCFNDFVRVYPQVSGSLQKKFVFAFFVIRAELFLYLVSLLKPLSIFKLFFFIHAHLSSSQYILK